MDKINLNTTASNLVFLNGQTILLEDASQEFTNTRFGHDLVQQALSGISPMKEDVFIVEKPEDEANNLITLSLQDMGLHLSEEKSDNYIELAENTHNFSCIPNVIDGNVMYQIHIPEPEVKTPKAKKPAIEPKKLSPVKVIDTSKKLILINQPDKRPVKVDNNIFSNKQNQIFVQTVPNNFIVNNNSFFVLNNQKLNEKIINQPIVFQNFTPAQLNQKSSSKVILPKKKKVANQEAKKSTKKTTANNSVYIVKPKLPETKPKETNEKTNDGKALNKSSIALASLAKKIVPISKNPKEKLTESQIKQVAAVLKNKSTSSALVDPGSDSKILCRVLYPEDFEPNSELKKLAETKKKLKTKRRRQKKKVEQKPQILIKARRTKSGRISKPPIPNDELQSTKIIQEIENDENIPKLLPGVTKFKTRRSSNCITCNKFILGKSRRATHLKLHPNHFLPNDNKKDTEKLKEQAKRIKMRSYLNVKKFIQKLRFEDVAKAVSDVFGKQLRLWDLIKYRLDNIEGQNGCGRVANLIAELEEAVNKIKNLSPKILSDFIPSLHQETINITDESVCSILGVKPGFYAPNDLGLNHEKRSFPDLEDHDAKRVKLDDVTNDTVKDLSDPALLQDIYSNQSELESVDQIVNERLRTLAPNEDIIPSLTPDDDLMEGLLKSVQPLSDSIMFNQPNETDDLYKTLENLAEEAVASYLI